MVTDLTGMELANASLLDESTAAAEAMALLFAVRERDSKEKLISISFLFLKKYYHKHYLFYKQELLLLGIELVIGNHEEF